MQSQADRRDEMRRSTGGDVRSGDRQGSPSPLTTTTLFGAWLTTMSSALAEGCATLRGRVGRTTPWLAGLGILVGLLYAFVVPMGLPYDEPSHWLNVLHVARQGTPPAVGLHDVTYEAQQGPVAYYLDAAIYRAFGSGPTGFYAVRVSGLVWLASCAVLTLRLVNRAWPLTAGGFSRAATLVALGNPMLVACAISVQNDLPALAFALLALDLAASCRSPALVGLCAGAAIITKLTTWPVLVAVLVWAVWRTRSTRPAVLTLAPAALVSGWWFARNVALYHDVTGSSAVRRLGIFWPPHGFHGLETVIWLARSAVTFVWLPVEYLRNAIHAPVPVEILVVVCTLLGAVLGLGAWRAMEPTGWLLTGVGASSIAMWAWVTLFVEGASFRLAYAAIPLWAGLLACALRRLPEKVMWAFVIVLLGVLHGWTLAAIATSS